MQHKYRLFQFVFMIGIIVLCAFPQNTTYSMHISTNLGRKMLVFSIDQGWYNGIINLQDTVGLQRIIENLKAFQSDYDVYVVLNPMNKDREKIENVLNILSSKSIPFIFDAYSSDIYTIGSRSNISSPYDVNHGRSLSLSDIRYYKNKYGAMFKGMRIFEVFGQDFTIRQCKSNHPEWCSGMHLPTDNFFQKPFAEEYIRFAYENNMIVIWSDFHWSTFASWDSVQFNYEIEIKNLMNTYKNTVILTYANNEPDEASRLRFANWQQSVQYAPSQGALGFGLSNQAWMCSDVEACPISEIISWTQSVFDRGGILVQFEPSWYFWTLPQGIISGDSSYITDAAWSSRGYPKFNLQNLASALGITIVSPLKLLATQANRTSLAWTYLGSDLMAGVSGEWVEYSVNFSTLSDYQLIVRAMNYNGNLPENYQFIFTGYIDGNQIGRFSIKGSTTSYEQGSLYIGSLVGTHTLRLVWENDAYNANLYDANVRIKDISFFSTNPAVIADFERGLDPRTTLTKSGDIVSKGPFYDWEQPPSPDGDDVTFWDIISDGDTVNEFVDFHLNMPPQNWSNYNTISLAFWPYSNGGNGRADIAVYLHDADNTGNSDGNGSHYLGGFVSSSSSVGVKYILNIPISEAWNRDQVNDLVIRVHESFFGGVGVSGAFERIHLYSVVLK